MASQGPLGGGTAASGGQSFSTVWDNTSNMLADDGVFSTASMLGGQTNTQTANVTNFGFSIPADATINGILVEWERKASDNTTPNPRDLAAKIIKGGILKTTNKASGTTWPTTKAFASYGGSSDLWGETWTPSDINASTFGAALSCQRTGSDPLTCSIDYCRITVYYTSPPSLGSLGTTAWTINRAYSSTITVSGGTAPYGTLTQSSLPTGLTASLSGSTITISGTPTVAGTYASISIGITDAAAATVSATYSITINAAPTLGSLGSTTGTVGTAYSSTIAVSGGTTAYGSLTQSNLPTGLTASLSGGTITISGTPTVAGTYASISIGITDAAGATVSGTYTITIASLAGHGALMLTGVG